MNFENESAFTRWFCEMVEAMGAKTVAFVGNTYQKNGIPDRYIAHPMFCGWVEFKRYNVHYKTCQKIFIEDMQKVGDVALGVRLMKGDRMAVEDTNQRIWAFLDLTMVYRLNDREIGKIFLEKLAEGWDNLQF